jgi:hypothetical protein
MKTTLDDLRVALHEQAHLTPYPDSDSLVAGARRRVGLARRRRLAALAASTAAVLVVGGLVATTTSARRTALQPAAPGLGSFSVDATGAGFPELFRGMRRVTVLDAPLLARMKGSISLSTTPGEKLSVQMTCTWPKDSALAAATSPDPVKDALFRQRVKVSFTGPGGKVISGCWAPGATDTVIGVATGATTMVSADISLVPDANPELVTPKGGKIQAAIYESVPWRQYPFPPRPTGVKTPVWPAVRPLPDGTPAGTVVSGALTRQVQGPTSAADANNPLSIGWPYNPKSNLVLQVRGPGRLRVLLNGYNISPAFANPCSFGRPDPCSNPGANPGSAIGWATPLRDDYLTYWNYEQVVTTLPLSPEMGALLLSGTGGAPATAPRLGDSLGMVIIPQDFTGPDWRVIYEPVG